MLHLHHDMMIFWDKWTNSCRLQPTFWVIVMLCFFSTLNANDAFSGKKLIGKKVVFLGDSITYGGGYVEWIEMAFRVRHPDRECHFWNLGLPSETVSGLSEDGHAGGRFPRPDVLERVDRVLERTQPDYVFTCYGMNCGIYKPLHTGNLDAYLAGYKKLIEKIDHSGAKVIVMTPPPFDPLPIIKRVSKNGESGPYSGYDSVMQTFSRALIDEFGQKYPVIDINSALTDFVIKRRISDPKFTLSGDGVHLNKLGHFLVFEKVIESLGFSIHTPDSGMWIPEKPLFTAGIPFSDDERKAFDKKYNHTPDLRASQSTIDQEKLVKLINKKHSLIKDTWLTYTGHKRPGLRKLEPFEKWMVEIQKVEESVQELLSDSKRN